jgi:hypothetical protein
MGGEGGLAPILLDGGRASLSPVGLGWRPAKNPKTPNVKTLLTRPSMCTSPLRGDRGDKAWTGVDNDEACYPRPAHTLTPLVHIAGLALPIIEIENLNP